MPDQIETLRDDIAKVLGLSPPPQDTPSSELLEWVEWWRSSYQTAKALSNAQIVYLKAGGWWPPADATQIGRIAPRIVRRALRPDLT